MSAAFAFPPPKSPLSPTLAAPPPKSPVSPSLGAVPPKSPRASSPPKSPAGPDHSYDHHDVDWQRNKFGSKCRMIRRQSSNDWESPKGNEKHQFARVDNNDDRFQAKIDLSCYPNFGVDEIDVAVWGYDVLVHARKENPENPNHALAEINRQYRLPDDVDLETVRLRKNKLKKEVSVDAEKTHGYGKNVMYNIVDVNPKNAVLKIV